MKKTILKLAIGVIGLLSIQSCTEPQLSDDSIKGRFISGEIKNANDKEAVLFVFENGKQFPIDTAVIKEGKFVLETKTKDLRLYFVLVDPADNTSVPVYIISDEKDKNITLTGELPKFVENFEISGSAQSADVKAYQDFSMQLLPAKKEVYEAMQIADSKDSLGLKSLINKLDSLVIMSREYAINFIENNEGSLASWLMLREFYPPSGIQDFNPIHLQYFTKVADGIKNKYPNSEYFGLIQQDIYGLSTQIENAKKQAELSEGKTEAPEITLPSPTGKVISLSSLRGKVILVDFWASWCKPCRFENPNVVANYEKFKAKGFTVFSVSLDKDKQAWENAIKADNLSWDYHVSDLKGWTSPAASAYGVQSIPASFLIDQDGAIIATNLRGPALEKKLNEILN